VKNTGHLHASLNEAAAAIGGDLMETRLW